MEKIKEKWGSAEVYTVCMLVAESPWGISDQNRNEGKMDGCEEFHNEISSSLKTLKEGTMRGYLRLQYFIEEVGNIVHHKLT